jgi:hypothetical protein
LLSLIPGRANVSRLGQAFSSLISSSLPFSLSSPPRTLFDDPREREREEETVGEREREGEREEGEG